MDDEYIPRSRHEGLKRNRIRIPKQKYDINVLPEIDFSTQREMTSTAKHLGLKECKRQGRHDPAKIRGGLSFREPKHLYFIYCRRCGDLLDMEEQ